MGLRRAGALVKPPAPPEVCALKLALRRMSREAREARKEWYAARDVDRQSDQPAAGAFVDLVTIGMYSGHVGHRAHPCTVGGALA